MNDVRLKAINRCGAVLIAATLRTFRLPTSLCAVSKVRTGPLQVLRMLETIFLVVLLIISWFLFENTSVVFFRFFRRQNSTFTIIIFSSALRPAANPKVSHVVDPQRTSGDCCRGKGPLPVQLKCASLTSFAFSSIQFIFCFLNCILNHFLACVRQCCVECHACISRNGRSATHTETSVCSQAAPKRVWLRCWRCSNPSIPLQLFWATVR